MKSTSMVLAALLAAQVVVAGALYYNTTSQRAVRPQGNLLSLDADAVEQISIESDNESVVLEKSDGVWSIGEIALPAEQSRVKQLLDTFSDLKPGWAVATSDSSHQQLEVADSKYQRRVMMSDGDGTVGDLYLGTSPGFKRSHVRKEGTDEVYSVAVNTFDLPAKALDWLDKTLLQVADVKSVALQDKLLTSPEEGQWVYQGSDNTDQEKAAEMAGAFENLRVTGIADTADDVEFQSVAVSAADEEYNFRFAVNGDNYLVAREDIDTVFQISKSTYDKVIEVDLLLPEPEAEVAAPDEKSDQPASEAEINTKSLAPVADTPAPEIPAPDVAAPDVPADGNTPAATGSEAPAQVEPKVPGVTSDTENGNQEPAQ